MKALLRKVLPAPVKALVVRCLTYFPDRQALSLPFPAELDRPGKAALISYVTGPFMAGAGSTLFTHAGVSRLMVRALNTLGYTVDVVEWSNTVFVPQREYGLFIGHAGRNFERLAEKLGPGCVKIYFSTGTYWKEHNRREEHRFARLEARRGVRLPPDRRIESSEERANEIADGIICLGNSVVRESYARFPVVLNLNNATYPPQDGGGLMAKDHTKSRRNFLFLASEGNVHKGLDLLLEAFSLPELSAVHLYICQKLRPDFQALYRCELEVAPNIHFAGHIDLRGDQFRDLVRRCSFMLHPSCAEGQPGAVLDCLGHGLIPVLTRENNIDLGNYGFPITDTISEIAETVRRLSNLPPEELAQRAAKARQAALTEFSEDKFFQAMRSSLQVILDRKRGLTE